MKRYGRNTENMPKYYSHWLIFSHSGRTFLGQKDKNKADKAGNPGLSGLARNLHKL